MSWTEPQRTAFAATLTKFWPNALRGETGPGELTTLWTREFERWPIEQVLQALRRVKAQETSPRTPSFEAVRQTLQSVAAPAARATQVQCPVCLGEGGVLVQVWLLPASYAVGGAPEGVREFTQRSLLVRPERARAWQPLPQDALGWPASLQLYCDHCSVQGRGLLVKEFTKRYHGYWSLEGGGVHHRAEILERILDGKRDTVERFGWKEFKKRVQAGKVEVDGRDLAFLERVLRPEKEPTKHRLPRVGEAGSRSPAPPPVTSEVSVGSGISEGLGTRRKAPRLKDEAHP